MTGEMLAGAAAGAALIVALSRAAELAEDRGMSKGAVVAALFGVALAGTYVATRAR